MLSWLKIKNFAIVSELDLDCPEKMSAFTGETGAGKSIMIDALGLLLGARADANVIRPHADKCDISAQFYFDSDSPIKSWLEEQELGQEQDELIIRRVINQDGRSKYFINGQVTTAQQIKYLGQMLVHIHGQHEQQNLLSHQNHREHLDHFSKAENLKNQVKAYYQEYHQSHLRLQALQQQHQSKEQLQLWQYQLNELAELQPKDDELEELYQEHHLLHHAQQYLETLLTIENHLQEQEDFAIEKQLHQVIQHLQHLPQEHESVKTMISLIDSALIQVQEASNELRLYQRQVQINPERLNEVDQRMSRWHQLARKFQIDAKELPAHATHIQGLIEQVQGLEQEKEDLEKACELARSNYLHAAQQLTAHRQKHAPELAQSIEQIIHELGMPHAKLCIDISPLEDMHIHGMDKVEYLIATNPGSQPGSLAKIASGGELSRISLSIHLITAQRGATPTLLFDEVDVGIGGATAMKVGKRLQELGERLQIFCVTHQPQVASCAHHHFLVQKYSQNHETFSSIQYLNQEGRIQEIARMLGGLSITEQTRNNAKELLSIID
jgi:DNA repair protein RecN (Recombination protein N)